MHSLLVLMMAIASGATVANLYYNQPLLAMLAQEFRASAHDTGLIPTLTQIGYALGILLFVPLGDLVERRRLIVTMLGCTAGALALAAVAPNLIWLVGASFAIGATAIAAQVMVPFAAQLAKPQERGKVVGTVMSGLLIGILLARTVSGFVGATLGWRSMYWLASALMVGLAIVMAKVLPRSQPSLQMDYPNLMRSLAHLVSQQPVLRQVSLIGAMSFGAFSAFWSTLAFLLEQPPYHYGSDVAGLFGLVGVVGASAAPVVGKLADRRSPRLTVGLGIAASTLSFIAFWALGYKIWGLVIGVILLDLGVQTTQISNQTSIYSLPAEIHSRLNALYIMFYFVGGALGSWLGAYSWSHWRWNGVCLLSLGLLTIAVMTFIGWSRDRSISALSSK
jgi:predicted MFS family arabinose efflux permease